MKCRKCGGTAVLELRRHNAAFCAPDFLDFFRNQVREAIRKYRMFEEDEHLLVAVSGGKDSLALWDVLIDEGYRTTGLYLDLGIFEYSVESRRKCETFAGGRNVPLIVSSVSQDGGVRVPETDRLHRRGVPVREGGDLDRSQGDPEPDGGGLAGREAQFLVRFSGQGPRRVRARRGGRAPRVRALRPSHHRDGLRLLQARGPGQAQDVAAPRPGHLRACLELAAAMAIVGSSVVVGKLVVARVPVFLVGGLRLAFACAVLVPLLLLVERGRPRLGRRDLALLGLQAFTGIFLFTTLLLSGLRLTSAAAAGIVTSTTPAGAGAPARLPPPERPAPARAGGGALARRGVPAGNVSAPAATPPPGPHTPPRNPLG